MPTSHKQLEPSLSTHWLPRENGHLRVRESDLQIYVKQSSIERLRSDQLFISVHESHSFEHP